MRNQAAARAPRGMLHVQHLVKQNVRDGVLRHAGPVQPAIQQDVIGSWIVTTKLAPPAAMAPADVRPLEFPLKVCGIQIVKYFLEIEVPPLRTRSSGTNAPAAHVMDASARAVRAGIFEIRRGKSGGGPPSVSPRPGPRPSAFRHREKPP